MNTPPIVSPEEWDAARGEKLLVRGEGATCARDALGGRSAGGCPGWPLTKDYSLRGPRRPCWASPTSSTAVAS